MTLISILYSILQQVFFIFLISACYLAGDGLLSLKKIQDYPWRRAIVDNSCHISLGFFSWLIVASGELRSMRTLYSCLICGFCAGFMDIDHFIEARSLHLNEVLTLHKRPFLHNTTLMLVSIISLISVFYCYDLRKLEHFSWILLVAVMSHHIRDSSHRGLWLWPISTVPFNNLSCIGITYFLSYCIGSLMNNLHKPIMFINNSIV